MSSANHRLDGEASISYPEFQEEFEDLEDIHDFETRALNGDLEPGIYEIDATELYGEAPAYPREDIRKTPGLDVDHTEHDIRSVALVLDGKEPLHAKKGFEEYLDRNYSEEEFLTLESAGEEHRVTMREEGDRVLLRACYQCD